MSLVRTILVLTVATAIVLVFPLGAAPGNRSTFEDPSGDGVGDPLDITTVEVRNDDAGVVSIAVTIANFGPADPRSSSLELSVFLDADENHATGDANGYDYLLQLGESRLWRSIRGSDFSPTPAPLTVTRAGKVFTFRVNRSDLGLTDGFRFLVDSNVPAHDARHEDTGGPWSYQVRFGSVLATLRTRPLAPKAGQRFEARLSVRLRGTGAPVTSGRIVCEASVARRSLRVLERRFDGKATVCAWQIPRGTEGDRLRGTITLMLNPSRGVSVGRRFDLQVHAS